ncbi:hypothetical protein MAPG_05697 [Magnaporthiopsis poae ATCC 64411]|uniref:Oxidoreductase acuF-like C2H2 type zinc-finger domain-containing protein n=1 Tax=Magnaporthiopsis poae (strain ATCC 64411 / 73-15) TaxID=644358 RepID=A0A0C4E031_MAGP6|nr:hypothetical protein MAPG_05697 [Magnaporthiopsis poae ATCC 64411]
MSQRKQRQNDAPSNEPPGWIFWETEYWSSRGRDYETIPEEPPLDSWHDGPALATASAEQSIQQPVGSPASVPKPSHTTTTRETDPTSNLTTKPPTPLPPLPPITFIPHPYGERGLYGSAVYRCDEIKFCLEAAVSVILAEAGRGTITPLAIHDIQDQFFVWAGNMGAMLEPSSKTSLENRLSTSGSVLRHIHKLLEDFQAALEETLEFILSKPSPDENDEEETDSELLLEDLSESLKGLFRAEALVRKSSAPDRFTQALVASSPIVSPTFEAGFMETETPKLKRATGRSKWLIDRLAQANLRRHQVHQYYRNHKQARGAAVGGHGAQSPESEQSPEAGDDDDTLSFLASETRTEEPGSRTSLPRLADLSPGQGAFECPICFQQCAFRSQEAWVRHAFADIRPYVCTHKDEQCDDLLFPDSSSWFKHELSRHRSKFVCKICNSPPFDSKGAFREHLKIHQVHTDEEIEDLEVAGRVVQSSFTAKDCPFCDEWETAIAARSEAGSTTVTGSQFREHVAAHLERIAMFSMPDGA